MAHSDKRVFLTGASGFVASHILADLIKVWFLTRIQLHHISPSIDDIYPVGLPDHCKRQIRSQSLRDLGPSSVLESINLIVNSEMLEKQVDS
jgi:hypothetical protein